MTPPPPINIEKEIKGAPEANDRPRYNWGSITIFTLAAVVSIVAIRFYYALNSQISQLEQQLVIERRDCKSELQLKDSLIYSLQAEKYQSVLDMLNIKEYRTSVIIQNQNIEK
mgnify:CR=1 FL=1